MPPDPDVYPYSTIAFITDTVGGQRLQGSGVLISPDEILTASHVVYSSDKGEASDITVDLGYNQGNVGIGTATAASVHHNPIMDPGDMMTPEQSQIDYAVIHLSKPFTGVGTMGVVPNFAGGSVTVAGYPATPGKQLEAASETVTLQPNLSVFRGTSIGQGSSGGPVWITGPDGGPYVVGLVSTGSVAAGGPATFVQISTSAANQIETWVTQDDGADPTLSVLDTSTGQKLPSVTAAYTGLVNGLRNQYISTTTDNLAISATSPGWFIHSGGGTDAIAVSSGTNVLDGGTGSNFLTGGGGTDTFFVDDRGATADIWDSINNFHAGDATTVWGVTQAGFNVAWADNQGAAGFLGLTLHIAATGTPNAAALTLVGFTQSDLQSGRLSVSFGTDAGSGSPYLYLTARG
jgi:V8-like Glu-specific endopeptidase